MQGCLSATFKDGFQKMTCVFITPGVIMCKLYQQTSTASIIQVGHYN